MTVRWRTCLIAASAALSLSLTSCGPPAHWETTTEAEQYFLDAMHKRYGREFTRADPAIGALKVGGLGDMSMLITAVGHPELIGGVTATSTGPVKDDWSVNLYRDQLDAPITAICDDYSEVITGCITDPRAEFTAQSWDPNLTLAEYLDQVIVDINIDVSFRDPDPDADAITVNKLIERFQANPTRWSLDIVNDENVTCFYQDWNKPVPAVAQIAEELRC
jgi:hypothetical protein